MTTKMKQNPEGFLFPCFLPYAALESPDRRFVFGFESLRFLKRLVEMQSLTSENQITRSFNASLVRVFWKMVFVLEPLIPFLATYLLNRKLKSWKRRNFIKSHRFRITRIGRFHYQIDLQLLIGTQQLEKIMNELVETISERLSKLVG
jgi:hypothetical protein